MPIQYPRKCEHCNYTSNNPSMYHYHKKTHDPIPFGQLCDHGCGQLATIRGTGGVYSCLLNAHQCPEYIRKHSAQIKAQWNDPAFDERRIKTRERFFKHCCGNTEVKAKTKQTLKKKFGNFTPEQMKDFRHYARRIRARAQKWAKEQGYVLGIQTYHVDHRFSVRDAWLANLPESVVNHPVNLEVIDAKKNASKGYKSSITIEELLKLCEFTLPIVK